MHHSTKTDNGVLFGFIIKITSGKFGVGATEELQTIPPPKYCFLDLAVSFFFFFFIIIFFNFIF